MANRISLDEQLTRDLAVFYDDPLGWVVWAFDWDKDESIQIVKWEGDPAFDKYRERFPGLRFGPDLWACEFLDQLGDEIRKRGFDGRVPVAAIQFATVSGHGIGKSTLVAWLILFILSTRFLSKGVVTATTNEQLRTKTWAELGKWLRRSPFEHWFSYTSGRGAMALRHREFPEEWFCTAQTSKEENSESFAGLHAVNSTPFYIFDEASGIPDKIYEVREGGTTDGEPMVFDFGNGTRNSGRFYEECVGKYRDKWIVREIDSRNVRITNKDRFKEWVDTYGEDSDFVRVRVRGMFPKAGSLQFIGNDLVEAAMARKPVLDRTAQLLIGVDVARFGDDTSVIWPRVGDDARSWPRRRFKGLDTVQLAGKVIEVIREFHDMGVKCAGLFIDGGGVGGGVVDQLRALGYNPIEVQFGGRPGDPKEYRFKADEMWGRMKEALRTRLVLPTKAEDPTGIEDLKGQFTGREYGYTLKGQLNLESKTDMKARGLDSPDDADALALTYAEIIAPSQLPANAEASQALQVKSEYDPLAQAW